MSTTPRKLIQGALEDLGELSAGQTASTEDLNIGKARLSDMLLAWNNERLEVWATKKEEFFWPAGISKRSNADLNIGRPVSIKNVTATIAPGFSFPVEVVGSEKWGTILEKTQTGLRPEMLFCDFEWPACNFEINPVPSVGATMDMYSWQQFTAVGDDLDVVIDYPPGYDAAMRSELMMLLAPAFSRPVTQEMVAAAQLSKQGLMTHNQPAVPGAAEEQTLRADVAQKTGGQSVPGAEPASS